MKLQSLSILLLATYVTLGKADEKHSYESPLKSVHSAAHQLYSRGEGAVKHAVKQVHGLGESFEHIIPQHHETVNHYIHHPDFQRVIDELWTTIADAGHEHVHHNQFNRFFRLLTRFGPDRFLLEFLSRGMVVPEELIKIIHEFWKTWNKIEQEGWKTIGRLENEYWKNFDRIEDQGMRHIQEWERDGFRLMDQFGHNNLLHRFGNLPNLIPSLPTPRVSFTIPPRHHTPTYEEHAKPAHYETPSHVRAVAYEEPAKVHYEEPAKVDYEEPAKVQYEEPAKIHFEEAAKAHGEPVKHEDTRAVHSILKSFSPSHLAGGKMLQLLEEY